MTTTAEVNEFTGKLAELVKETRLLYGLTHNYTGYPLVKEARDMIRGGKLGKLRKVVVEYPQGWLATRIENTGQKQAGCKDHFGFGNGHRFRHHFSNPLA